MSPTMSTPVTVTIRCGQVDCPNYRKVVNRVTVPASELEAFLEGYGHGAQGEADVCPVCDHLGDLEEMSAHVE